jgi:hypothetical protein
LFRTIQLIGISVALHFCSVPYAVGQLAQFDSGNQQISTAEYYDKVAGSWLGQIIGNTYGLSYEFKFLEEPGPNEFPYGYGEMLERVREVNGAFSDDDTDLEYMYLLQMEKHGIEPTYAQLTEAWRYHIRERIWAANRVALTLMRHGYYPPLTGDKERNPRWFEIDPQLINEIWAVTAPGMIDYAVQKSAWAARITNSDFGIEPTMHYAAMYSAAFFESDVNRLIDIGLAHLPPNGRFAGVVREMKDLYALHPDDWQAARKTLKERYYDEQPYNLHGWPPIDATLNGAAGILSLLYGQGDVQRTLDFACAMGFDADNQAATMTGLLGIIHGMSGLPRDLLFPLPDSGWTEPFNDRYVNVTRHDLPDASLKDMITRLVRQGGNVVLIHGGKLIEEGDASYLQIPTSATFNAPMEMNPAPELLLTLGEPFKYSIYTGRYDYQVDWSLIGSLPSGVQLFNGVISGVPSEMGHFPITLSVIAGGNVMTQTFSLTVRGPNLAPRASELIHNGPAEGLETLRDTLFQDPVFYSEPTDTSETVYYGYRWEDPIEIRRLGFHVGWPMEETGWFAEFRVEYLGESGIWVEVSELAVDPEFNFGNNHYLKPGFVEYDLRFMPTTTTGIRLIGVSGGREDVDSPVYSTAISELTVH